MEDKQTTRSKQQASKKQENSMASQQALATALALSSSNTNWNAVVPARAPPPPPPKKKKLKLNAKKAPKCVKDGCECEAAKNKYYPNSEGGEFWTLCEECFILPDGDEYDEVRVVEDYENCGRTDEEKDQDWLDSLEAFARHPSSALQAVKVFLPTEAERLAHTERIDRMMEQIRVNEAAAEVMREQIRVEATTEVAIEQRTTAAPTQVADEEDETELQDEFWNGGMVEMWGSALREGHPLWEPYKLYKAMKKEQE